jgi:hypothetical protein
MRKSNELREAPRKSTRLLLGAAASLVVALGLQTTGCVATLHDADYVEVDDAPVALETYPHRVYEGRDVYYYNDHWYYRRGPRWGYYRETPAPLRRERVYVQRAPRSRPPRSRPPAYVRRAPERRIEPERHEAPPAVQVR